MFFISTEIKRMKKFEKSEYDLILSLGGSCSVAKQLIFKNLRTESFPFDWLFHKSNETLKYLIQGFSDDFKDFLLKENLRPSSLEERGDSDRLQYKDKLTGYFSIHDFDKEEDYPKVYKKYQRRINRLKKRLSHSNRILLILDASYHVDLTYLTLIRKAIQSKYKIPVVDIYLLQFNSNISQDYYFEEKSLSDSKNIRIIHIRRNICKDDFEKQPEYWNFLKSIERKRNFIDIFTKGEIIRKIRKKFYSKIIV